METLLKLSPAQSLLLRTAARRADGRVIPPDTLRGGARVKVLTALLQRGCLPRHRRAGLQGTGHDQELDRGHSKRLVTQVIELRTFTLRAA